MIGFSALLLVDVRSGFGVAVLMNSPLGRRLDLVRFALACLDAEAGGTALPEVPDPPDPYRVEGGAAYEGRYSDEEGEVVVSGSGGGLVLETDGRRASLVPDLPDVFVVDDPALERFPIRFVREGARMGGASWGPRWLHERSAGPIPLVHPDSWSRYPGRYASWNPWAPGFRVFLRRAELWLAFTGDASDADGERRLTELADGWFRVGPEWSPDRVRFDAVIDGKATRAVFDAAPFYRTFVP
jgi:hypothetical protein